MKVLCSPVYTQQTGELAAEIFEPQKPIQRQFTAVLFDRGYIWQEAELVMNINHKDCQIEINEKGELKKRRSVQPAVSALFPSFLNRSRTYNDCRIGSMQRRNNRTHHPTSSWYR